MLAEQDILREIRAIRASLPARTQRLACSVCGRTANVERHHESYFVARETTPLCVVHHIARHKELREDGCDPTRVYVEARLGGAPPPREAHAGLPHVETRIRESLRSATCERKAAIRDAARRAAKRALLTATPTVRS
jgi:hypothetical protein